MSLIGFRRDGGHIEYLEEVEYSEDHLEEDLHALIRNEPRLVMGTLTSRDNVVLGSNLSLPSGKELDLLTCDKRGTLTVVEFKRNQSPRKAVTQLFDYASSLEQLNLEEFLDLVDRESVEAIFDDFDRDEDAEFDIDDFQQHLTEGLESPQLMLVAYSFTKDMRRITRWLRDVHDLKVNCVEFDYYRRDDAEMFVPTVIGADETQEIKDSEARPRERKYQRFHGDLLDRLGDRMPNLTSQDAPTASHVIIPTGHRDAELKWRFKGDPGDKRLWVEMNFRFDDKARNEELLDLTLEALQDQKVEIDEEIHREGQYANSGYTRFYIEREVGTLEDALEDDEAKEWVVDTIVKLYEHLTPVLNRELR